MAHLVALTTNLLPEGGDHRQPQVAIYAAYLRLLNRVGLTAVLVTPAHDGADVAALVGASAGLVLSGGGDIEPGRYGEEPIQALDEVVPARDEAELRALEVALGKGVPIFGICRGMQLLNVHFGGTLYQDLAMQYEAGPGHVQSAPWGEHHHRVRCVEGSRIHAALAGCEPLEINSFHHQAVKELAPSVRATARADDGLIEGIESTEHDWVVGVQWHPERYEAGPSDEDPNVRIMAAFAERVRGWSDGAGGQ